MMRLFLSFFCCCLMTVLPNAAHADAPNKDAALTLRHNQAQARGYVGGESYDRYSILLHAGKSVRIQVDSKGHAAEFLLSEEPNFGSAEQVKDGVANELDRSWRGTVKSTARYYIFVTAHPDARYRLTIIESL